MGLGRAGRRACLAASLAATLGVYVVLLIAHWSLDPPPRRVPLRRDDDEEGPSTSRLPSVTGRSAISRFHSVPRYACPGTRRPAAVAKTNGGLWQTLDGGDAVYLYSAHLDRRLRDDRGAVFPYVRIVAMVRGSGGPPRPLHCQTWTSSAPRNDTGHQHQQQQQPSLVVRASAKEIWLPAWDPGGESGNLYGAYLVSCPAGEGDAAVSLVSGQDPCRGPAENLLPFAPEASPGDAGYDFAVCVKGLDFAEDTSTALVEWIELHRLLGADRFTFYEFHVHPNVSRVLDWYGQLGVAERVPLTLPGTQPNSARERSAFLRRNVWQKRKDELVPYNDCFYRHHARARFVIPLDVDEVLVPVRHDNWTAMIRQLTDQDPGILDQHASLSAQQVYFFEEEPPSGPPPPSPPPSAPSFTPLLGRSRRTRDPSPPGHGVKSFVVTRRALTVFNHYPLHVYPLEGGGGEGGPVRRQALLPSRLARLHHYKARCPRDTEGPRGCEAYLARMTTDTLLRDKYAHALVPRVAGVLRQLKLLT